MELAKQIVLQFKCFFNIRVNIIGKCTQFYRIREEGGSGRPPPPTVHLRTDDVT